MGAPLFEQSSYLGMPMTSIATSTSARAGIVFAPKFPRGGLRRGLRFTFHDTRREARISFIRAGFARVGGFSEPPEVAKRQDHK